MKLQLNTESPAARAIMAMAHKAGTAEIYTNTLARLSNAILFNQDDMGMDDSEALNTIRVLSLLSCDVKDIATGVAHCIELADKEGNEIEISIPRDPWQATSRALKSLVDHLGIKYGNNDMPEEVVELLDFIGVLLYRLGNVNESMEVEAENADFNATSEDSTSLRVWARLAQLKTEHTSEIVQELLGRMTREGYPSEKLTAIAEASDMQMTSAEILKRHLAELNADETKEEGCGDGE